MAIDRVQADAQFVILGVDREVFAVPVDTVVEILELRELFRVPDAPPYLAGLIDVRGRGVPVIDLRVKLGLADKPPTESTRIMVLEVATDGRELVLGLIVDRVFEVAPLERDRIEPPPDIGSRWRSNAIHGIGRRGQAFVLIFDLARLFASDSQLFNAAPDIATPDIAALGVHATPARTSIPQTAEV
jgi:purine-binding chemotaxis protein CheW